MEKLLYGSNAVWSRSQGDYHVSFANGSKIYFFSEQIDKDPELNRFLGLETNGILLEQIEELDIRTWDKAKQRTGSWKIPRIAIDENPPAFLFATFNPTNNWLKTEIYDKYITGTLEKPYFYMSALPTDNQFNSKEQYNNWENLDGQSYDRFIKGIWDYEDDKPKFAHEFNIQKHIHNIKYNNLERVYLSLDFGKNPNVCIVLQSDLRTFIHVIKEFSSSKGLIELMYEVRVWLENNKIDNVTLTGDPSGATWSQYEAIKIVLQNPNENKANKSRFIEINEVQTPPVHPVIKGRTLLNSVLKNFEEVKIDSQCKNLIRDLMFTEIFYEKETGALKILKTGANSSIKKDNSELSHNLDAFRYFIYAFFKWFLKFGI
jgi:hypothetical protein